MKTEPDPRPEVVYLGDAVYAYFDGYGIELRLNTHLAPRAVYLEPEVMAELITFFERHRQT